MEDTVKTRASGIFKQPLTFKAFSIYLSSPLTNVGKVLADTRL